MFLLDAGVWVASVASDDDHHLSASNLVATKGIALATLDLTFYEVANVVGFKRRKPREAARLARLMTTSCSGRIVAVSLDLAAEAAQIAYDHAITAYDAAYVAAAGGNGWTLVSTDVKDLVSKGLAVTPDAAL